MEYFDEILQIYVQNTLSCIFWFLSYLPLIYVKKSVLAKFLLWNIIKFYAVGQGPLLWSFKFLSALNNLINIFFLYILPNTSST